VLCGLSFAPSPSERLHFRELWEKSLEDGAERLLTVRDIEDDEMTPRWTRDGTRISYRRVVWNPEHTDTKFEIIILHLGSNVEQALTLEADAIVSDWSAGWPMASWIYRLPRPKTFLGLPIPRVSHSRGKGNALGCFRSSGQLLCAALLA
jgi:hypothetical protein